MAKVSLKGVTKNYSANGGAVTAVGDLTLEIQDREFVVLAGPRNCGLSSIARMIAGLENVSKGDIFIGDRCVNDLPPNERDIALVSQNYTPYPRMSVHDNIAFGLKSRKFRDAEVKKRVVEAAGIVGLQELLERKPESLEQRQRLAVARALALQPKVFVFDEPLAGLEATTRAQMRSEIVKLRQRLDATAIYATHDPLEAMVLGGRIVVLSDGVLQQAGTARELYDEPANVFVAGFLGAAPMNFVRGTLKQERDWLLFTETEEGTIEVRLPESQFPGASEFAGKPVLLGVRPEEIGIAEAAAPEKYGGDFPALIDHVERTGSETYLHLRTGPHTLMGRVPAGVSIAEAGHRGRFMLNRNGLRLFDPVSKHRIGQRT